MLCHLCVWAPTSWTRTTSPLPIHPSNRSATVCVCVECVGGRGGAHAHILPQGCLLIDDNNEYHAMSLPVMWLSQGKSSPEALAPHHSVHT
jgi:hypothetical protein